MSRIILVLACCLYSCLCIANHETESSIRMGAEQMEMLLPALKNKRVALVINQTSIVGINQSLLLDTLVSEGVSVKKIFAPEHGFRGNADAGETIKNSKDIKTGIPIVSIYGNNKKPTKSQLSDVDIVVFDIQDVGARFYTYISSLQYIMEACAENDKELIVCDRPNPNDYIDGPVLKLGYQSFVGMHPIPVLHGLTMGELALMINGENWIVRNPVGKPNLNYKQLKCKLKILPIQRWKHGQPYNLPIKPSPNLPNQQSIKLYPSLCFFEATNISVGRGTTFPFQVIGSTDKKYGTFTFTPKCLEGWDKAPLLQDKVCFGVDLRKSNISGGLNLNFFISFYSLSEEKDNFFSRPKWFDLLAGNQTLRQQIISGMNEDSIRQYWANDLLEYKEKRKKYLLYPES